MNLPPECFGSLLILAAVHTSLAADRVNFAAGDSLYSIEKSGNLYRINRTDGSWIQIGK